MFHPLYAVPTHTLNTPSPSQPVTGLGSIKFDGFVSCAIKYQSIPAASTSSGSGSGSEESGAPNEDTSSATTQEQEVNEKEDSVETMSESDCLCSGEGVCDCNPSGCSGSGCISKSEVVALGWTTVGFVFAAVFLAI